MQVVAIIAKTTIKQINWLIFCIVLCCCLTLEVIVDEYEQVCKFTSTYFPNTCHCTKFFECSNGKFVSFNCPDGLHFNPRKNVCDWPYRAGCHAHCIRRGYPCDRHTEPCCHGLRCRHCRDDVDCDDDVTDDAAALDVAAAADVGVADDTLLAGDVDGHHRRGHCVRHH